MSRWLGSNLQGPAAVALSTQGRGAILTNRRSLTDDFCLGLGEPGSSLPHRVSPPSALTGSLCPSMVVPLCSAYSLPESHPCQPHLVPLGRPGLSSAACGGASGSSER